MEATNEGGSKNAEIKSGIPTRCLAGARAGQILGPQAGMPVSLPRRLGPGGQYLPRNPCAEHH